MTIQLVVTESAELTRTKVPALPFGPVEYDRQYQDQLNNILRQYFNTLDNFVAQLALSTAGSAFVVPYGAFSCFSQTTLTAAITNSVTTIPVVSTASFPVASVGTPKAFFIDDETITYTGTIYWVCPWRSWQCGGSASNKRSSRREANCLCP